MTRHKVDLNGYNVLHFGIKLSSKIQNPARIPYTVYPYRKNKKLAILCLEGVDSKYTDINGNTLYYNNTLNVSFTIKLSVDVISIHPATLLDTSLNHNVTHTQTTLEKIKNRIMHDFSIDETQFNYLLSRGYSISILDEARELYLVAPVTKTSLEMLLAKQNISWYDVFDYFPYNLQQTTISFKKATLPKAIELITIIDTVLKLLDKKTNYDVIKAVDVL